MKILVTGFTPFGNETINPSYEVTRLLPLSVNGAEIFTAEIHTDFGQSFDQLLAQINSLQPDAILLLGQAGGRQGITVEKVAINYAEIKDQRYDSQGVIENNTIDENGVTAYFATIPVEKIVKTLCDNGFDCQLSLTAGSFVCNYLLYCALQYCARFSPDTLVGFVHLPFCAEQVKDKNPAPYSMILPTMSDAIELALSVIADEILSNEADKPDDI